MKLDSKKIALAARVSALQMTHVSKASHIGSSLSMIDILSVIASDAQLAQNGDLGDEIIISNS